MYSPCKKKSVMSNDVTLEKRYISFTSIFHTVRMRKNRRELAVLLKYCFMMIRVVLAEMKKVKPT